MMAHIPFLLSDDRSYAELHLVRSNPIARMLKAEPLLARIAVSGPHSYISPDWYNVPDQVPTWNYVAVQFWGQLELLEQDHLGGILDRLSAHFENQLAPKAPWKTSKMTPDVLERMKRQIVPIKLSVAGVDGTWKLNQNKDDPVRLHAADAVECNGIGTEREALAAYMREA